MSSYTHFSLFCRWKRPLSWFLALVPWLVPIASIFTPGTLTVSLAKVNPPPTSMTQVPALSFTSLSFSADMHSTGAGADTDKYQEIYSYNGPSQALKRVATAVLVEGAILPITPPSPNSTWELDFYGPALSCSNVTDSSILSNISSSSFNDTSCAEPYGYLAWASENFNVSTWTDTASADSLGAAGDFASLFIATMPSRWQYIEMSSHTTPMPCVIDQLTTAEAQSLLELSTAVQCQLFNASYHTTFQYINGEQEISVQYTLDNDQGPITTIRNVYGSVQGRSTCATLNTDGTECFFNKTLVQNLAYQSILDGFNQRIVGSVTANLDGTSSDGVMQQTADTEITDSVLLQTPQLAFLRDNNYGTATSLQSTLQSANYSNAAGTYTNPYPESAALINTTLTSALETAFMNLTVSLMSSALLLPDSDSADAPGPVLVAFETYHNIYVYSANKLWLSYGLAALFTALAILVGAVAMQRDGGMLSNYFSTVMRTTRWAHLSPEVEEIDSGGTNPLPEYIGKALITFGGLANLRAGYQTKTQEAEAEGLQHRQENSSLESTARRAPAVE